MRIKTIVCFFTLKFLALSWCYIHPIILYSTTEKINKNRVDNKISSIEQISPKTDHSKMFEKKDNKQKDKSVFEKTNMRNSFNDSGLLYDTITYIAESGIIALNNIEKNIIKQLNFKSPETSAVSFMSENYYSSMDNYTDLMLDEMVTCELEREFYILQFLDTLNKKLAEQSAVLLKNMMKDNNDTVVRSYKVKNILKYIDTVVLDEKIDSFAYICNKLNICKRFPAYSDHIAEIISEIIILPEKKFAEFLYLFNDIIINKAKFLKKIMDVDTIFTPNLSSTLSHMEGNITKAREIFITVKRIINSRHQIFKNKNGDITLRKKALRILIDLFDRSFETLSESNIRTNINIMIKGLKQWTFDDKVDIQKILMKFFDIIEKRIMTFLAIGEVRIEVRALIDIIMKGFSKYIIMINDALFTKGSKFVNYITPESNKPPLIQPNEL